MRVLLALLVSTLIVWPSSAEEIVLPAQKWPFQGPLGLYDKAELQRGFQVYREVCAACHSLDLLSYRNLREIGLSEAAVKAIATSVQVTDGPNEQGEIFERPGLPTDRFKAPFPNAQAARVANNGALPPDLSLMAKARFNGTDYIYALLIGYTEPPAGMTMNEGLFFNRYFPGQQIAMPQPLAEGMVEYSDGTEASVDRMARDVAAFLTWAAEPNQDARKRLGLSVVLALGIIAALFYLVKRRIWSDLH
jgi:ubiquinol-cytochrome c reductase cytochrome c1 subunit